MSSAGPSQRKRFKADSGDANSIFKTTAEIDKALAAQGNVDSVIRTLSSLHSQFQHAGTHQITLKQWIQSTSAEALLNLWDHLESEGAYGKVLSMLLSLLSTILRYLSSMSDSDNRLARSLLSATRVAKLNAYLAGKNSNKNAPSTQNSLLVAETLNLLTALVNWDSKAVLESVRWDIEALPRLVRANRRDGKGKGKEKVKLHHNADSRPRASLLSLICAMLAEDVPARVKSAFLAPGTPTLSLLQNILSGIGTSYQDDEYLYSYTQIKNLLETLYVGIWCDKRVPRSAKVVMLAFGHGPNTAMRNEGGGKRGGQVGGEKVWKGLLALYSRTVFESSLSEEDEGGVPADLVHHFLLAICTRPGQGVCFRDKGWYPPNHSDKNVYYDENLDVDTLSNNLTFSNEDTQNSSNKHTVHNPLLLRVLRLLTPSADLRQQELAARILEACPELVASCGDVISGGPGALDPRLNARWMAGMAWYGRVVSLPIPEEVFYLPTSDVTAGRTPRVTPPPVRSVVESVVPSFSGGGTKTILTKALSAGNSVENHPETAGSGSAGSGKGLIQHTVTLTLCRCLGKYVQVRAAFLRAAQAAGELEEVNESIARGERNEGPWIKRLAEVNKEVRARLPDIQVVLAFLKRVEVATQQESSSSSTTFKTANPTALALLSESVHRLVWLYHACFSPSSGTADEGLGKFDVGGLVGSLSIITAEGLENSEEEGVPTEISGLKMMKDVHILRTLRLSGEFGSRIFTKAGKQTHLHLLLRAFARGSVIRDSQKAGHLVLQGEIRRLLEQVLSRSVLFRHNETNGHHGGSEEEIRLWLAAVADCKDFFDADIVVSFLDDCVQRCMRTPERYLDTLDEIREATMSQWSEENTQSLGLPSPLIMTLLEQLVHRIHAVSTQERQQPPNTPKSASEFSLHSLLALLVFFRGLFVRLAAFCEPRALPVLWALIGKMKSGKDFEGEESRAIESVRLEVMGLQKMLKFTHTGLNGNDEEPGLDSVVTETEARKKDLEVLYSESTTARVSNPTWRTMLVESVFIGQEDMVTDNSMNVLSAQILRTVRLVSHSLAAVTVSREPNQQDVSPFIVSLLLLIAHLMTKLSESRVLSVQVKRLVKEYIFRKNPVLRDFWMESRGLEVCEAIKAFLDSSSLNAGDSTDRSIVADITEHWVSHLRTQLQSARLSESISVALVWLRYADPNALFGLFDLAYTSRLQPELTLTAIYVISAIIEALGSHTQMDFNAAADFGSESLTVAAQLRRRLSLFLSLSSEQTKSSLSQSFDSTTLEQLVLYALQSRLPVGHDGLLPDTSNEPSTSFHHRRRHRWRQRLEDIQELPSSDVFVQHYLSRDDTKTWSGTTVAVICCTIYSGCIEQDALNSWLIRLSDDDDDQLFENLAPILRAHLDCVLARGGVSEIEEGQREVFWKACEAHFSRLVNYAFRVDPALSTEIQATCGTFIGLLLELIKMDPSAHGQKLTGLLVGHIGTLSVEGISMILLVVGRKSISGLNNGLVGVVEAVVDHALQWAVRMLTGCREIEDQDARLLIELTNILSAISRVKSHLAEPVLTAVARDHLHSEIALQLLEVMLPIAHLKPLIVNRHLQILVQHPHFTKITTPSAKHALTDVLYTLFHLHPVNTCQPSHIQPLVALYGGSASVADRKLLAIFYLFEGQRRTSVASLLARWSPLPEGFQSASALDALKNVDSLLVLRTALHFPQWCVLGDADLHSGWEERPEGSDVYDPAFLLLLFAHVLAEEAPKTAQGWVEVFRTNIVGLVIRALSAKDESLRGLAAAQIAVLWTCLENADMLEKPHVLHILSLLRDALHPVHGHALDRLPSYTTLLLTHSLRGVFYPSNFIYPITARFLLQRPALDIADVPLLYGMLYSSAEDHGKKDRIWILRMLADGMQSSADWRVFKRRHTWDLLASVFQSEERERALRRGVLEVLANLTCIPQAAMSLLLKSSLLAWIEMQLLTPQEDEGLAWLKILENIVVMADSNKMESSTSGEWRACAVRCLVLLIDGCRALRTFPVFHLFTRTVLRLALLPGPTISQMPKLLTRCVSVIQDLEKNIGFFAASTSDLSFSSEPIFKAPHGASRLHEAPQLSDTALCEVQGESIEQLWRVSMLVDEEKLPAWDELTSLLLVWRARVGERSIEGEWVRKEVLRNISFLG